MTASSSSAASASRKLVNLLSPRTTLPPILNLPSTFFGNNKPKSLHKTRRTWKINAQRVDLPVHVLETAHYKKMAGNANQTVNVLKGVKMNMRHLRSFEKSGGVEGALLSRPPSAFTPFGKQLRSALFQQLTTMRDNQSAKQVTDATASPSISNQHSAAASSPARGMFSLGI